MDFRYFLLWLAMGICLIVTIGWNDCVAQEDSYDLAHTDIFGNLRRPPVIFAHDIHSDTLVDEGCGVCHHVRDNKTGKLVYAEGDELSCKECHVSQKENGKPALREAYHGSCTVCHRNWIKSSESKSGPTTCGGCHQKT